MEDGTKRVLQELVGRRKLKRGTLKFFSIFFVFSVVDFFFLLLLSFLTPSFFLLHLFSSKKQSRPTGYEYECRWRGLAPTDTTWMTRAKLEERGFSKLITEIDVKEAARLGMHAKPLTQAQVEKHLMDLGIDPEFGTHSHIRGLSGGQKVKVVIAAAMWQSPHMLILDEPTNYLDREALGALSEAIKDFGGGVVIITHNREFADAVCPEKWAVADGKLTATGQPAAALEAAKLEWKAQEETVDALGNVVKVKGMKKTRSRKEIKAALKARKARRDRGEEVSSDSELDAIEDEKA